MKFLQKAFVIFLLILLPSLTVAECPYNNPNYKPEHLRVCKVPDGVYAMSDQLSGSGAVNNYTVLLFVKGSSVRMLVKDKTSADNDFIVSPKHPRRRGKHGHHSMDDIQPEDIKPKDGDYEVLAEDIKPEDGNDEVLAEDEYWDDDEYTNEHSSVNDTSSDYASNLHRPGHPALRRPAFCTGRKINICFGPDSQRAVAMPGTLLGRVELMVNGNKDTLSGYIILDGAISTINSVVLRKQNR